MKLTIQHSCEIDGQTIMLKSMEHACIQNFMENKMHMTQIVELTKRMMELGTTQMHSTRTVHSFKFHS
uniref:Uncharacterized protein n=1 Tax=Rhizophora mucronata TaxID=61149 RepID=A0A2P2PKV1_RHIMU